MTRRSAFVRSMSILAVVAVIAWALFAWAYRTFFDTHVTHAEPLGVWWAWLAAGTGGFIVVFEVMSRLLRVSSADRVAAAVASTAPALVCDMLTGTQPQVWLAGAGEAADTRYLALIVGGVGLLQLYAMLTSSPVRATSEDHGSEAQPRGLAGRSAPSGS